MATDITRREAPCFIRAHARVAAGLGSSWTAWHSWTGFRRNAASLTSQFDYAARQWHCSVTLDRTFFILSGAVVTTAGMVAALVTLPCLMPCRFMQGCLRIHAFGIILVTALAVRRRWAVSFRNGSVLSRVRYFSGWIERKRSLIHSVENKLLDFYHHTPGAFWSSFALNLACHGAAVFEVYLILWLMGVKISFFAALAIEALTKLVNVVGIFNPGNIGTYEGGNMLIARMFGMSATAG